MGSPGPEFAGPPLLKWGGTPLFDASERRHRRQANPRPIIVQSATVSFFGCGRHGRQPRSPKRQNDGALAPVVVVVWIPRPTAQPWAKQNPSVEGLHGSYCSATLASYPGNFALAWPRPFPPAGAPRSASPGVVLVRLECLLHRPREAAHSTVWKRRVRCAYFRRRSGS